MEHVAALSIYALFSFVGLQTSQMAKINTTIPGSTMSVVSFSLIHNCLNFHAMVQTVVVSLYSGILINLYSKRVYSLFPF